MRLPTTIERLYLDFDGFFASVEQQCDKCLRGRPVGVVPFEGTDRTAVIACSRRAKAFGVKNVMPIKEAKRRCPDIVLVPQKPDLYCRAHNALLSEIETVFAINTAKSIDELTCRLNEAGRAHPIDLSARIKAAISENVGHCITSTIGFAANRQLAKMTCKAGKHSRGVHGNRLTVWHTQDMPAPLYAVTMEDILGAGSNMARRFYRCNIYSSEQLFQIQLQHSKRTSYHTPVAHQGGLGEKTTMRAGCGYDYQCATDHGSNRAACPWATMINLSFPRYRICGRKSAMSIHTA